MDKPIKVLIADDQALIRQGIAYLLRLQPELEVVGEAGTGEEAISIVEQSGPDVILMDIQMPGLSGIETTKEILKIRPETRIIILTTFDVYDYVIEGIRAGAVGYVLKDEDSEELLRMIKRVMNGEAMFSTTGAAKALADIITEKPSKTLAKGILLEDLTDREIEVLQQMSYGHSNEEISRILYISEGTVKIHVHRILSKMGVKDRTQAVVLAIRNNMVD